jgi:uncharacterized membrane protein
MIESGFGYISSLVMIASTIVWIEKKSSWRLFSYLPSIVIIYFTLMSLSSLGLWTQTEAIDATYRSFKSHLLPSMIFLMLLMANLREIGKLGGKMIFTFLLASLSIMIGFIGMFALLKSYFEADAWRPFGALAGSWLGGSGNMVAIQEALNIPQSAMGYTLLIDSINYALWVMLLLALVPFASRFNRWSGATTTTIDNLSATLSQQESTRTPMEFSTLFLLLGIALVVSSLSQYLATLLPTHAMLSHTTWVVIIATTLGVLLALTPLAKLSGANTLGTMMLYLIVALIASRANFAELTQAPLYIGAGFVILSIHLLLMLLFAKLFRLDLFSIGVASLANIGGVASAPILASAYAKSLIPIGILMAMLGYILGTFGGLMVAQILQYIR